MPDHRSRIEKLRAMALQTSSPQEAAVARRMLEAMGEKVEEIDPLKNINYSQARPDKKPAQPFYASSAPRNDFYERYQREYFDRFRATPTGGWSDPYNFSRGGADRPLTYEEVRNVFDFIYRAQSRPADAGARVHDEFVRRYEEEIKRQDREYYRKTQHEFMGRDDRDCELCGFPDRFKMHQWGDESWDEAIERERDEALKAEMEQFAKEMDEEYERKEKEKFERERKRRDEQFRNTYGKEPWER